MTKGPVINVGMFPAELQPMLRAVDDEGDGNLEVDELAQVFTMYAEVKKANEEGSMAISALPKSMQKTLATFDVDGNGRVTPVELARGADLYASSKNQVQRLTKLAAVLLFIILLTIGAIVGLVFVVVEESKENHTRDDGVMTVKGNSNPVATGGAERLTSVFNTPAMGTTDLKNIKSLDFQFDTDSVGYTVTGFTKNTNFVVFYTARGDEIRVTSSFLTITNSAGDTLYTQSRVSSTRLHRMLLQSGGGSPTGDTTGCHTGVTTAMNETLTTLTCWEKYPGEDTALYQAQCDADTSGPCKWYEWATGLGYCTKEYCSETWNQNSAADCTSMSDMYQCAWDPNRPVGSQCYNDPSLPTPAPTISCWSLTTSADCTAQSQCYWTQWDASYGSCAEDWCQYNNAVSDCEANAMWGCSNFAADPICRYDPTKDPYSPSYIASTFPPPYFSQAPTPDTWTSDTIAPTPASTIAPTADSHAFHAPPLDLGVPPGAI